MNKRNRNSNNVIKGAILRPNSRIEKWFAAQLTDMTRRMTREVMRELLVIYEAGEEQISFDASVTSRIRIRRNALLNRWQKQFNAKGEELAKEMVRRTSRNADITLRASVKTMAGTFSLKGPIGSPKLTEAIKASVEQSVDLIKTIPQKYFADITGAVMRSIQSGGSLEALRKELGRHSKRSARHVELMALDQTRKAYAAVSERKMEDLGITSFEWVHSGGARDPRDYHKNVLNGLIFRLDAPPIVDPNTGERGLPGSLPNCRCLKRPVIYLGQ